MTERYEWDFPATMRPRRGRRPPRPLEGEILTAEEPEPTPRIHRVEVTVHRRRQQIPPWALAMVIIGCLCWLSPFGMVVALVMGGILVTAHPAIATAIGVIIAAVVIVAMRERRAGREF